MDKVQANSKKNTTLYLNAVGILEIALGVYVCAVLCSNILNILGITEFYSFYMKDTFLSISMLAVVVFESFLDIHTHNIRRARMIIIAVAVANTVAATDKYALLMLLAIIGIIMLASIKQELELKPFVICIFLIIALLEGYSIIMLVGRNYEKNIISEFIISAGIDCIFVIISIIVLLMNDDKKRIKLNKVVVLIMGLLCIGIAMLCAVKYLYGYMTYFKNVNAIANRVENAYIIRAYSNSDYVIAAQPVEGSEGCRLHYTQYTGANEQKFSLELKGDGTYIIKCVDKEQVFDVDNGGMVSGTKVNTWTIYDTATQRWRILEVEDAVVISSAYNDLVISVPSEGVKEDDNVLLYEWSPGEKQNFILERTISDEAITVYVESHKGIYKEMTLIPYLKEKYNLNQNAIYIIIALISVITIVASILLKNMSCILYGILFVYSMAYGSISACIVIGIMGLVLAIINNCKLEEV